MAIRLKAVVATVAVTALIMGFRSSGNAVQAKWSAFVIHTGAGEADIHFTAEIPGGWRMYSQNMAGQDGPLATNIEFDPDPQYTVVGSTRESGKTVTFYQNELGMEVKCLEGKAEYVQHISYKEDKPFAVKCMVNYMLNREGEILPPDDEDFTISIQPD